MPFAFYDLETTGRSSAFDQPLQLAAILTDDDFKEIERRDIRCRLAPHILPSPIAMAVTGLRPSTLLDPSLPDWFTFAQQLREIVQVWAPATWVGFNTMKFDEEFLRQTFYQNLQPNLYETQFHGNDRLDIMLAVFAVRVLKPDLLNWPTNSNGNVVFKLDQLAPLNGFNNHNAHDALGDVEATIHMARLICDRDPELWTRILANRDKKVVMRLLADVQPYQLIERPGSHQPKEFIGCLCGVNPNNANSIGFFDLGLDDPAKYVDADDEAIAKAISKSPAVIKTVAINKAPNLFPCKNPGQKAADGAALIASRPDFRERVGEILAKRYEERDKVEQPIEWQIYNGFYSARDKELLDNFQEADWATRRQLISSFEDVRLQQLGRRVSVLADLGNATEAEKKMATEFIHDRWSEPSENKPEWTTADAVSAGIEKLEEEGSMSDQQLDELKQFYQERLNSVGIISFE